MGSKGSLPCSDSSATGPYSDYSSPRPPHILKTHLILPFHLRLGRKSCLFLFGFSNTLYASLLSPIRATFPFNLPS